LCRFSTSVYCCLFLYRLSPETFGYTLVHFPVTKQHAMKTYGGVEVKPHTLLSSAVDRVERNVKKGNVVLVLN